MRLAFLDKWRMLFRSLCRSEMVDVWLLSLSMTYQKPPFDTESVDTLIRMFVKRKGKKEIVTLTHFKKDTLCTFLKRRHFHFLLPLLT